MLHQNRIFISYIYIYEHTTIFSIENRSILHLDPRKRLQSALGCLNTPRFDVRRSTVLAKGSAKNDEHIKIWKAFGKHIYIEKHRNIYIYTHGKHRNIDTTQTLIYGKPPVSPNLIHKWWILHISIDSGHDASKSIWSFDLPKSRKLTTRSALARKHQTLEFKQHPIPWYVIILPSTDCEKFQYVPVKNYHKLGLSSFHVSFFSHSTA